MILLERLGEREMGNVWMQTRDIAVLGRRLNPEATPPGYDFKNNLNYYVRYNQM